MARRFYVRTYGCQMNEHDSERIAGLARGRGHGADRRPRSGRCRRPQHVLHPRERRQQALRPPRRPQGAETAAARASRSRSAVAWRRRTGSSCASGPVTSTWSSARTTSPTRPRCSRRPRSRADRRDPRGARGVPVRVAGAPRGRPRGVGHDPDRLRQHVRVLHRAGRARQGSVRRMGDIVHEVEELAADGVVEITLLGQNVNSYGRDLGAGQYRPQFADLLRTLDAVDGIERIRFTSPTSEGPAARDDRGDGRVRARCASTCTCRCSRAAIARSRACTAATPPSATWNGWRRPGPRSTTSR